MKAPKTVGLSHPSTTAIEEKLYKAIETRQQQI